MSIFYISKEFANAVRQCSPCFIYRYVHSVQVVQLMTSTEMHVKCSVTLADRLGPEILTLLEIKSQVLHRVRLHLKAPD